jgi:hypothetical protein
MLIFSSSSLAAPILEPVFAEQHIHCRYHEQHADRQHQRQQRQQIDRVTERLHDEQGADQGQWDRDQRHDDGAPVTEKQEDNGGNDQPGLEQGLDDLVNRAVDNVVLS